MNSYIATKANYLCDICDNILNAEHIESRWEPLFEHKLNEFGSNFQTDKSMILTIEWGYFSLQGINIPQELRRKIEDGGRGKVHQSKYLQCKALISNKADILTVQTEPAPREAERKLEWKYIIFWTIYSFSQFFPFGEFFQGRYLPALEKAKTVTREGPTPPCKVENHPMPR